MRRILQAVGISGLLIFANLIFAGPLAAQTTVKIAQGELRGAKNADGSVLMFKDVPFAAPPVGSLRWKDPQPPVGWKGVREADKFGPPCLQTNVFGDIYFRDAKPSEDCLNLDIWEPAHHGKQKLAVFLWFYGGGFVAGSASEPRYDGEALAKKGIIVVNANYRLGVFGFLAYPGLTRESPHHASGNYGLLDQVAALHWVIQNIAAFGGNPHNITVGGESAGSFSVSALMVSPLSKNLFQKAVGESGAYFTSPSSTRGALPLVPLAEAEQHGVKFAESLGAHSLAQLRAMPAEKLLLAAAKPGEGFAPIMDGYFLRESVLSTYEKGEQSHVPLLAGWNADEGKIMVLMARQKPTPKSFAEMAQKRFGDRAAEFLKLYPAATEKETLASAEALAGDDFTQWCTWKWLDMQRKTGDAPVYQYHFEQVPPTAPGAMIRGIPASEQGSKHAGELEYVFNTMKYKPTWPWSAEDHQLADAMTSYWANFVKTGNPNGKGLPEWPRLDKQDGFQVMHLKGGDIHAGPAGTLLRGRYVFLDESPAPKK